MSAKVIPFRDKTDRLLEQLCGCPCPWCAQVVCRFELKRHRACVDEVPKFFENLSDYIRYHKSSPEYSA
jgi:hypothetical protein